MTVPKNLTHKPIIVVNDYNKKDGKYSPNSDAKALSIGQAQYNKDEISVKVFRHTGNNWSRQSEELPIHRVFDLAILITASMQSFPNNKNSLSSLDEYILEPTRHQEVLDYFKTHKNILQPRIDELKYLLSNL